MLPNLTTSLARTGYLFAALSLAYVGQAQAATTNIPAGTCDPILNGTGQFHSHITPYGIVNASKDAMAVSCPVIRQQTSNSLLVTVLGSVKDGATMSCSLSSNYAEGASSIHKSFSVTAPATASTPVQKTLSVNPDEVTAGAFFSVSCSLEGNRKARLRGLVVVN